MSNTTIQDTITHGNGWKSLALAILLLSPSAFVEVAEVTRMSVSPTNLMTLVYMVGIFLKFLLVPAATVLALLNCLRPAVAWYCKVASGVVASAGSVVLLTFTSVIRVA